jgi:hypothetical protein
LTGGNVCVVEGGGDLGGNNDLGRMERGDRTLSSGGDREAGDNRWKLGGVKGAQLLWQDGGGDADCAGVLHGGTVAVGEGDETLSGRGTGGFVRRLSKRE